MSDEALPTAVLAALVVERKERTVLKSVDRPYIGLEHLQSGSPDLIGSAPSSSSTSMNNIFHVNDILFGKLRPYLRKSVLAPFDGYCSTDIIVLRAITGTLPGFAARMFQSEPVFARAVSTSVGTKMPRTAWSAVRRIEVFLPDIGEQTRIAAILDTLDDTIRQTEQVIAKLQLMKQGLLHDLLTRGIDENGEVRDPDRRPELFKDSVLGRIPRGWDDRKVGSLILGIEQGWSPDCRGWPASAGRWGVLKTTAVTWAGYDGTENKELPESLAPRREYEVRPNDVLMTRAGPNSRVGVVALVEHTRQRVMLSDKLYRIVPGFEVRPDFLVLSLSGTRTQMHLSRLKTGLAESQTNISQAIVRALRVSIPPLAEQSRIATRAAWYDRAVSAENEELQKLSLLKQGLMDDLLTGKVRVPLEPA